MAPVNKTCRKCRTSLRGIAYLQLAMGSSVKGSQSLCITCADRYIDRGTYRSLRQMVETYTAATRPSTGVQALRREVERLQAQLESLRQQQELPYSSGTGYSSVYPPRSTGSK